MKKRYTVSLDEESAERVKAELEKRKMTFSGFLNAAIIEYDNALKNMGLPDEVGKMTIADFMAMFRRMMKELKC